MKKENRDEQILRASKEIIVKFIEVGRLSPTGFAETFKSIYQAIDETLREREQTVVETKASPAAGGKVRPHPPSASGA